MEQSYKILFSDIGGVLLTNGWGHESREAAAKRFGIDYGEMDVFTTLYLMCMRWGKFPWMFILIRLCLIIPGIFREKNLKILCLPNR